MSIIGQRTTITLSSLRVAEIKRQIEERETKEAILHVVDGGDLDHGRVSRMEWIATDAIQVDAETIDALLCDGDRAERVREHINKQVARLTEEWLTTYRGVAWLEQRVAECLDDELDYEMERLEVAQAESLSHELPFEEGGKS